MNAFLLALLLFISTVIIIEFVHSLLSNNSGYPEEIRHLKSKLDCLERIEEMYKAMTKDDEISDETITNYYE